MESSISKLQNNTANILNPKTNKQIGQIVLIGDQVPATEWINAQGPLQSFVVLEGREHLKTVWMSQAEVLLQVNGNQGLVKIVTYPSEGEDQGFLNFTSEFSKAPDNPSARKSRLLTQRGFSFIQSLFSM